MNNGYERQTISRVATALAIATAVAIAVLASSEARAFSIDHDGWPNGEFSYAVNQDSFTNNFFGLSISHTQANFWVRWALANWRERAGLDLAFTELGDTNLGDAGNDDCFNLQNKNFYAVSPECLEMVPGVPDCGIVGDTRTFKIIGTNTVVRTQVCLAGPSNDWETDINALSSGEQDMQSALMHETGHVLGLNESVGAVMNPAHSLGTTWQRYLYGDDITGIRSVPNYSTISALLRARPLVGSTVQAAFTVTSTAAWGRIGATIGNTGGTARVIRTAPSASGVAIQFTRADHPISASSTWTNRSLSGTPGTWISPAITFGAGKFVAAWPNKQNTNGSCAGIRVAVSTDAFDSVSQVNFPNDCTRQPVALGFDGGQFVLAWSDNSTSLTAHDKINFRTSADGISWTGVLPGSLLTHSGPSIACSTVTNDCLLAYTEPSRSAGVETHSLQVTPGQVSWSGGLILATPTLHGPSAGSRSNGTNTYIATWTNLNQELLLEIAPSAPISVFDDQFSLLSPSFNSSGITSNTGFSTSYVFYTQ